MRVLVLLLLLSCPVIAADGPYPVRVLRVLDGDTLEIEARIWPGLVVRDKLRLVGVNTPELKGKPCEAQAAKLATEFARAWVTDRYVIVLTLTGKDKYGRLLGRLHSGDSDLGAELIKSGHAKAYTGGLRAAWC